jgi:hypothetical protein
MFLADGREQAPCLSALSASRSLIHCLTSGLESRQKLGVDGLQTLSDERRGIDDVGHSTILLDVPVRRHPELPISRPAVCVGEAGGPAAARSGQYALLLSFDGDATVRSVSRPDAARNTPVKGFVLNNCGS